LITTVPVFIPGLLPHRNNLLDIIDFTPIKD
jgi:hypothetical protein